MRHDEGHSVPSKLPLDHQLQELVEDACTRIECQLKRYAPFLGVEVCAWMAQLSPTDKASDYFLQPRSFPYLRLPLWAARSFASSTDEGFLADVIYSTVNGYYHIRLLDNLMDGHGTVELKILPATAFFHTEFQATYQKYFSSDHPFWEIFRSAWFSGNEAVTREMDLTCIDAMDFEHITVAKLAAAKIPLAAVAFHSRADEQLRIWEDFATALARWSQMEDDLFDWHHDLSHGKTSHFLSQARRHKSDETVEAWIIRRGFQRGIEDLQNELPGLRCRALRLQSSEVMHYLDIRETMLEEQKEKIGEAFRVLVDVASITQANAVEIPD
jgi:hypothetical protein